MFHCRGRRYTKYLVLETGAFGRAITISMPRIHREAEKAGLLVLRAFEGANTRR